MAIKGSLKEASLPDVLQLLAMGKKTGCLSVSHRNNFGYIYFDRGKIAYASIVNRRDRLGDILVKSGLIAQEALDDAISQQGRERNRRLGEILVGKGALSREELHRQIRIQIEEAVYFLFTWTQGTFNFEADVHPDEQDLLVSINPESLLLEGARRVDEWSLIEKKVPSMDTVFDVDRSRFAEREAGLTPEQETLVPLIDGKRDVTALVDDSGLGEFEVGKALYGLATAGFLHRVGKSRPSETVVPDARIEEHRNLGVAFYKTGMLEEAMREFRRVTELREDDAHARFYVGLVYIRQGKWTDAATALRDASAMGGAKPAVFHNLAYVLERLGRYDEAKLALREALDRGGVEDARVHLSVAVLALRRGDLRVAEAALEASKSRSGKKGPSAAWFHYAALTAALKGDLERAGSLLADGIRQYPHAAPLFNNLAVLHERRGNFDDATLNTERGLVEDASLAQLHKNAGDYAYRAGKYDDALESYQRAVKLSPSLGEDVYLKLGNIRYRRGESSEAERCWERACSLDPDNAIVRANLEAVRRERPAARRTQG